PRTARLRVSLPANIPNANAIGFSPDGTTLVTGTHGPVVLWDAASGRQLAVLAGEHTWGVCGATFSPDGKTVASAALGFSRQGRPVPGEVVLWDVARRKARFVFKFQGGGSSVAFSPDGKTLATGEQYGHVVLWDAATGSRKHTLPGAFGWVWAVAFS